MLIEFRTENHRSLRDEQVLSLEATRGAPDSRDRRIEGSNPVLPVAALYGANASGKSNVLAGLRFMRDAVVHSHRFWEPDAGVPRDPFAWGPKRSEPSLFEIAFVLDGVRVEYGFGVNDERFLEEWLYAWPHGRKQVWFEREGDSFRYGEHLKGENRVAESVTRPNGLFLSAAVQNRHEQLEPVFRWFRNCRYHNVTGSRGAEPLGRIAHEEAFRWLGIESSQRELFVKYDEEERLNRVRRFRELLTSADVGIIDFKVQSDETDRASEPWARRARTRVFMQHKSNTPDAWLPLERESHGTRQLFRLAPLILAALDAGAVLVVDELEASFHPLLALQIVQTFNDPIKNARNAQLVFSTHDTNLLGTTLGEPSLRRDQVWLTEKDQEGASVLYPLTDYKPRKEENLERGYLQGRYGGIPFLGPLAQVLE
jgi:uncharacterized protein